MCVIHKYFTKYSIHNFNLYIGRRVNLVYDFRKLLNVVLCMLRKTIKYIYDIIFPRLYSLDQISHIY